MPKSYLRYVPERTAGLVASHGSNITVNGRTGLVCTPCLEDVGVWDLRTGQQVRGRTLWGGGVILPVLSTCACVSAHYLLAVYHMMITRVFASCHTALRAAQRGGPRGGDLHRGAPPRSRYHRRRVRALMCYFVMIAFLWAWQCDAARSPAHLDNQNFMTTFVGCLMLDWHVGRGTTVHTCDTSIHEIDGVDNQSNCFAGTQTGECTFGTAPSAHAP